jgi:hypothetical protein
LAFLQSSSLRRMMTPNQNHQVYLSHLFHDNSLSSTIRLPVHLNKIIQGRGTYSFSCQHHIHLITTAMMTYSVTIQNLFNHNITRYSLLRMYSYIGRWKSSPVAINDTSFIQFPKQFSHFERNEGRIRFLYYNFSLAYVGIYDGQYSDDPTYVFALQNLTHSLDMTYQSYDYP